MADLTADQALLLQGRLDALQTAMATGMTSVSYEGKSVSYRSLSDMRSARDEILRQLGLPAPTRRTVAAFNGGFR